MSDNVFKSASSKLEGMSAELGFDIPVELAALPSQGLVYSSTHPFSNTQEVEIRSMTSREEDLLTSPALIKKGIVIDKLLEACLCAKGIDVKSLLVGDRNAILIAIRTVGYGSSYSLKIECPTCSETYENEFSLNKLEIKKLGAEPEVPLSNIFTFKLPLSGFVVKFKLLTGADELEMNQAAEARKKAIKSDVDNRVTARLLQSVLSVNGEEGAKAAQIISNLRAGDSLALRRYMEKIEPGVKMTQEATCKVCGDSQEVKVPIGPTFFWPDAST